MQRNNNVKAMETKQVQADFGEKSDLAASGQHRARFYFSVALPLKGTLLEKLVLFLARGIRATR